MSSKQFFGWKSYETLSFEDGIYNIDGGQAHIFERYLDKDSCISFSLIHSAAERTQDFSLRLSLSYDFLGPAIPWQEKYYISLIGHKLDFEICDKDLKKDTKSLIPRRFNIVAPRKVFLHIRNVVNSENQYELRVNQ